MTLMVKDMSSSGGTNQFHELIPPGVGHGELRRICAVHLRLLGTHIIDAKLWDALIEL